MTSLGFGLEDPSKAGHLAREDDDCDLEGHDHRRSDWGQKMDGSSSKKPTHDKEESSDGDSSEEEDTSAKTGPSPSAKAKAKAKYLTEHHITAHYRGPMVDLLGGKEVRMSPVFPVAFDTVPHTGRKIGGDFTRSVPASGSITSMTNTYPFPVAINIPGFGSDIPHGYAAVIGPGRTRDFVEGEGALIPIATSSKDTWSADDLKSHYTGSLSDPTVGLRVTSDGTASNPIAQWLVTNGKDHPVIGTTFKDKMFRNKTTERKECNVKSDHVAVAVKALDEIHQSITNKPVNATPGVYAMTVVGLPVDKKNKVTDYATADSKHYGVTVQARLAYVPTEVLAKPTE